MPRDGTQVDPRPHRRRRPGGARRIALYLAGLVALLPGGAAAGQITVFAAASLKTALDEIAADFEEETGHRVLRSFAGTSVLARQIEQGAPADVFISANPDWMDHLEARGRIAEGTRRDLVANTLVLITHGEGAPVEIGPGLDLSGMLGSRPLALAMVEAVPGGIYGKAALVNLGLWEAVAQRVVQTDNVRSALALVALGEALLGIVYATDAHAEPRVSVLGRFPADSHPPILYPAAAVVGAAQPETDEFLAYLSGEAGRAVFARNGFTPIGE